MSPKVLIVEDDYLTALGMADVVALAGYRVIGSARSVSEAIEKARIAPPDIAVFDIRLAGRRDGIEGAAILKERWGTEVLFLSAENDDDTLERATALGPVAVLAKPCHPRDLLIAVQKAAGPEQTRPAHGWI
jgi:DNA-binding NarL/FixJ family response regulator